MTDMRDARFQKALQEAPDAAARPAPQVAQAILDAARNALPAPPQPVATTPWWQRLWHNTGKPSAPWNATFATLLVAVLVTVMWVREPVPDARPLADSAPPTAPKGESSPAPAPAKAPARATAPAPAPAPPQNPPLSKMADAAPPAAPPLVQTLAANKATAAVAAEEQSQTARLQKDAGTEALASADVSGLDRWTAMQIQMQGSTTTLNRLQAQPLFAGMVRLARQIRQIPAASRTPSAVPTTEPALRLTVVSQGLTQAVMVLWDDTVLWQRPAKDDVIASATAADVQTLLQLARQSSAVEQTD